MVDPEVCWIRQAAMGRLAIMPRPRGDDWLREEIRALRSKGVTRIVSLLQEREARALGLAAEALACEDHGLAFTSFPIPDRGVPNALGEVAQLVLSIDVTLRAGGAVAIHCRAGIGRSGLIAACVLVAQGLPRADAFPRISRARGLEVPDTDAQIAWLETFAQGFKSTAGPDGKGSGV